MPRVCSWRPSLRQGDPRSAGCSLARVPLSSSFRCSVARISRLERRGDREEGRRGERTPVTSYPGNNRPNRARGPISQKGTGTAESETETRGDVGIQAELLSLLRGGGGSLGRANVKERVTRAARGQSSRLLAYLHSSPRGGRPSSASFSRRSVYSPSLVVIRAARRRKRARVIDDSREGETQ